MRVDGSRVKGTGALCPGLSRKDMIHMGEALHPIRRDPHLLRVNKPWTFAHSLHILSLGFEGDMRIAHFRFQPFRRRFLRAHWICGLAGLPPFVGDADSILSRFDC